MTSVRTKIVVIVVLLTFLGIEIANGFTVAIHRTVTKSVLSMITADVVGQPVTFSNRALEEIADANESMDGIRNRSAALFHPERHFTNEEFVSASTRLINLRNNIVQLVTANPPDGAKARILLGNALHAVQDFYSHSNWVELGNTTINSNLGRVLMADPATTLQPCPNDPNILGPGGGGGLTSAYFVGGIFAPGPVGCGPLPFPGKC